MSMKTNTLMSTLLVLLLTGCGDEELQKAQPIPGPPMSEDNVFKPQLDALDSAKDVEQTIRDGFEQNRREIDVE